MVEPIIVVRLEATDGHCQWGLGSRVRWGEGDKGGWVKVCDPRHAVPVR